MKKTVRSEKAYKNKRDFLKPFVDITDKVTFPSLYTIQIHVPHRWCNECDALAEKMRLNKRNINVYFQKFADDSNDFSLMLQMYSNFDMVWLLVGEFLMSYYRPQRSCGQDHIFTPVCHSVHRGGVLSPMGGVLSPGGCT